LAFFEENVELGFKLVAEALDAAPSLSWLWASQGFLHMFYRNSADAVAAFEMAKCLDPRNPLSFRNNLGMAGAKIQLSDFADALGLALEAHEHAPENITVLRLLAACYAGLNDPDKATFFANEVIRLAPTFRISTHASTHPMRHAKNFSILRNAMIKAGIPD
jgi:tetratricopeptide (TPR) repeat protein